MPSKIKYIIEFFLFCVAVVGNYYFFSRNVAIGAERLKNTHEKLTTHIDTDAKLHEEFRCEHRRIYDKIDDIKDRLVKS